MNFCRFGRMWCRIIAVLVVVMFWSGLVAAFADDHRVAEVRWIPDGDTVILEDDTTIRLQGIDTPETRHDDQPEQYFAQEARKALQMYVEQGMRFVPSQEGKDRYGRVLARGFLSDGRLVNEVLVRDGLAFFYPHPHQDPKLQDRLLRAQQEAMRAGRGFWPRILDMPEADEPYLGNTRSFRFHRLECPFGQKTAQGNRRHFGSLYDAFYAGFAPCRRCTVWPEK